MADFGWPRILAPTLGAIGILVGTAFRDGVGVPTRNGVGVAETVLENMTVELGETDVEMPHNRRQAPACQVDKNLA